MDSFDPPDDGRCEADACCEICGFFIVSCCDCSPILEPVEGALDQIALFIKAPVIAWRIVPDARFGWNDGLSASGVEELSYIFGIVGFVGEQPARRW